MARYEMGADTASMAEAKPTPENFFELGMIYSAGREGVADLVAAHKWFNLAAVKGNRDAAAYRQEVAREMTAAAVAEAQRAAREWRPNGTQAADGSYLAGRRDGRWRFWDEHGQLTADVFYRDGVRVSLPLGGGMLPHEP